MVPTVAFQQRLYSINYKDRSSVKRARRAADSLEVRAAHQLSAALSSVASAVVPRKVTVLSLVHK
eukprot:6189330-Pleurochrysis_carterae.AAC.1